MVLVCQLLLLVCQLLLLECQPLLLACQLLLLACQLQLLVCHFLYQAYQPMCCVWRSLRSTNFFNSSGL